MLRTNLATRPFYNERAVRLGIAAAVVGVAAFTAFNALQIVTLNARNSELTTRAEIAEEQTASFRQKAQGIRQALNNDEMTAMQNAAREANLLIDRRVFSWTELFNQFERTLPADVRISAVAPQTDSKGQMLVAITVISRSAEDLNEFMDELESSGQFREVLSRQDSLIEDGLTQSVVQAYYQPQASPTGGAPAASEPSDDANASPSRPANASPPAAEQRR